MTFVKQVRITWQILQTRTDIFQFSIFCQNKTKQESPPAWTQEAYRPPCIEYSFCCPIWVAPPSWPGWGGVTWPGYPPKAGHPHPDLAGEVPDQGSPPAGYPLGRVLPPAGYPTQQGTPQQGTPPQLDLAGYPPGVCPMAFWEMLQSIMGYGYPPVDRQIDGQTRVKTLPSRRGR